MLTLSFLNRMKKLIHIIFSVVTVFFISSCAFEKLGQEVTILDQTSILKESHSTPSLHKKPITLPPSHTVSLVILLTQFLSTRRKHEIYQPFELEKL